MLVRRITITRSSGIVRWMLSPSPRRTSYHLTLWTAQLKALHNTQSRRNIDARPHQARAFSCLSYHDWQRSARSWNFLFSQYLLLQPVAQSFEVTVCSNRNSSNFGRRPLMISGFSFEECFLATSIYFRLMNGAFSWWEKTLPWMLSWNRLWCASTQFFSSTFNLSCGKTAPSPFSHKSSVSNRTGHFPRGFSFNPWTRKKRTAI